jgi:hypothetical protein
MSAFKQKLARLGATAGVFVGSTAAVLAIAGIGASSASAAPTCVNIPAAARNLGAQGSTLQHVAQETGPVVRFRPLSGRPRTPPFHSPRATRRNAPDLKMRRSATRVPVVARP